MERRKSNFKKGVSADDSRRHREAAAVAIRKEKKQENMLKRRNMCASEPNAADESNSTTSSPKPPVARSTADFLALRDGLISHEFNTQLASIKGFRKALAVEHNPPIQECIECGAIPLFVQYLQRHDATPLQFEASWALTNIASTSHTSLIVEHGAVPHLVALMHSSNEDLREQCAWCLGNVAGDSASLRDVVLGHDAMQALLANIAQPASLSLLRNCVWSLSNFCRGKPQPHLSHVASALPVLAALITQQNDFEVISDAVWALSYVSDGRNDRIQAVVETGNGVVVPALINMLRSNRLQVMVPALRTLGNIVSGSDSQTQLVVNHGVLDAVLPLLSSVKKNIRKEVCWMLSNIAAGNRAQLSKLMSSPGVVAAVVEQLAASNDWEVRKEAAWVISNIVTSSEGVDNWGYVQEVVSMGVLEPLCSLLDVGDARIVLVAMESIDSILSAAMAVSVASGGSNKVLEQYCRIVEEHEGIDKLEGLQQHESEDVYKKAVSIIETYFGGEDEEDEDVDVDDGGYCDAAPLSQQQKQQQQQQGFGPCYNFNSDAGARAGPGLENAAPNGMRYDFGMPAGQGVGTTKPTGLEFSASATSTNANGFSSSMPPAPPSAFELGRL